MPAFLKIGDIEGQASDTDHKGWVILQSMSTSIHRSIPQGAKDQQRTRGETTLGDIILVRELDKSSVKLKEACATGKFYDGVEIHFCTTIGNKQDPYLKYKLNNVIVSSYTFHGNASGDPQPSEEVTLSFNEVEWTYVHLDPKTGKSQGQVAGKYNPGTGRA